VARNCLKMKKYFIFTILICVIAFFFFFNHAKVEKERILIRKQTQENKDGKNTNANLKNSKIDIEKTVVSCINGENYDGKTLIDRGIVFKLIGDTIFYKGEELERLCNPNIESYDYDNKPSYLIVPKNFEL